MSAELLAVNIAAHWVQAGVLAATAFVAMRVLNLNEPRARLAALHVTLVAIALLPLVQPWRTKGPPLETTSLAVVTSVGPLTQAAAGGSIGAASILDPSFAVVAIAVAGVLMRMLWLLYGIIRLARFNRRASMVPPPAVASPLEAELAVSARYIQQAGARGPWTFGWLHPTVALPTGFDALVPAFQRAVVCHELVHVKRRDMLVAFCEELAVAALWFHPWIWLLRGRIRIAREQVVDGRVVTMLGNRDEYVRCLVDISGHDLAPHFSQAGAGMLRPRELRARVDAIFQEVHMSRMRFGIAAGSFIVVMIAAGLVGAAAMPLRAVPIAPAVPSTVAAPSGVVSSFSRTSAAAPQAAADTPRKQINTVYPEYPQDALERGIKGTVVVDITIDAAGDVTTAAVAGGPQELRASAFKAALALKYTPASSRTAMTIAFEYSLTGTSWGVRIFGDGQSNTGQRFPVTRQTDAATTTGPSAGPDASGALRVGGDLQPPRKLKDVPPEYPALAQQGRVQGVVIMEVRVDERGAVSDVRTLRSIPLLDQAAIDAVKQWQYEPTLMNGVAIPVIMTVTVNFTLRELLQMRVVLPDGNSMPFDAYSGELLSWEFAGIGKFQLRASRERASNDATVSVFTDGGQTHLGDVVVALNGPVVQSPTTPSVGLQLLGVR